MAALKIAYACLLMLLLSNCAYQSENTALYSGEYESSMIRPAEAADYSHVVIAAAVQCVPYAREISGVSIYGDAWTWWDKSKGRYARGSKPEEMAVLVLSKTNRLKLGHIAVVTRVLGPRQLLVTHANWGSNPVERAKIRLNMPVLDVSTKNDWSVVRFWNPNTGVYGNEYKVAGFVYSTPLTQQASR